MARLLTITGTEAPGRRFHERQQMLFRMLVLPRLDPPPTLSTRCIVMILRPECGSAIRTTRAIIATPLLGAAAAVPGFFGYISVPCVLRGLGMSVHTQITQKIVTSGNCRLLLCSITNQCRRFLTADSSS
jgi:hypothetical protein